MKKHLLPLLVLLLFSFAIVSCGSDDDDEAPVSIIGTWEAVSSDVEIAASINGIPLQQELIELFLGSSGFDLEILDEDDNSTIEFKSNGTYVVTDDDGTETGTYTVSNDNKIVILTFTDDDDDDDDSPDETQFNIVSLTATNMTVQSLVEDSFEEDGDLIEIALDMEVSLRKIN
jgi:hypothetical protein